MEEKVVVTNQVNEKHLVETYLLFEYSVKEKKINGNKIQYTFIRDDSVPYIKELKELEYQYPNYKIGGMLTTVLFPGIAFVLFTVFLVLFIINRDNKDLLITLFCSLCIPAAVFILFGALMMFYRISKINKIEKEKPIVDEKFKKKIEELKK